MRPRTDSGSRMRSHSSPSVRDRTIDTAVHERMRVDGHSACICMQACVRACVRACVSCACLRACFLLHACTRASRKLEGAHVHQVINTAPQTMAAGPDDGSRGTKPKSHFTLPKQKSVRAARRHAPRASRLVRALGGLGLPPGNERGRAYASLWWQRRWGYAERRESGTISGARRGADQETPNFVAPSQSGCRLLFAWILEPRRMLVRSAL